MRLYPLKRLTSASWPRRNPPFTWQLLQWKPLVVDRDGGPLLAGGSDSHSRQPLMLLA
jgi:hypothetical protein